jgi:RES domain-containing protein
MIFLWGHASDSALQAVYEALRRLGVAIAFYDQRLVLQTDIHLTVEAAVAGTIRVKDEEIDLAEVSAAYIRPFDSRWLPGVEKAGPNSPEWLHAVRVEDALTSWSDIAPGLVINRPAAMASNSSKPYQAEQIRACGFRVPDTLVTTDPLAALEFWHSHGVVIYKSVSASRSVVSRLTAEHASRLDDIRWCPTQFQQHIPGNDYRVHVVGDRVFASEIVSSVDDYRFALAQQSQVEIRRFTVPDSVAERCADLTAALGLAVAGIDLRRTLDDEWFCFEANAVPGFAYYQAATGDHIDDAIASLLVEGVVSRLERS